MILIVRVDGIMSVVQNADTSDYIEIAIDMLLEVFPCPIIAVTSIDR